MNAVAVATLTAALLALFGAAATWHLARAPIWSDLRRLAAVAAATALYGLLEVASLGPLSPAAFSVVSHLIGAASPLVAWSWLRYSAVFLGDSSPRPLGRLLGRTLLGCAALALLPGVAMDGSRATSVLDPVLGGSWRHAALTPVGIAIVAVVLLSGLYVAARLVGAWRAGSGRAGAIALSFGAAIPFALFDSTVHADFLRGPHLLGLMLAVPVATGAWLAARQFIADADALQELRGRLEGLVEERTRELAEANSALLQAEKLAALGQFAAGVAHEVNNPASVVTADLAWLSGALARGAKFEEAKEVLDESMDAMWRINDLVRKLLDAGRLADLPPSAGAVALSGAVERAFTALRARAPLDVELLNRVPDDLVVRGGAPAVDQIVANLVANGVEAIPPGRRGRVEVSARVDGSIVRLVVEDDGHGMPADALRRAFDPFFTTKPLGRGNGLGLPMTRGLVEGIGGQIWLESEPGKGTRAAVELPAATPG